MPLYNYPKDAFKQQLESFKADLINKKHQNYEFAVELISNVITDPDKPNAELLSLIIDLIPDYFLIDIINKIIKDNKTFENAATYLSPLTKRILEMPQYCQNIIFAGNDYVTFDVYSGKAIRIYSAAENDYYLNKGEFGLARLIHKIKIKADSFSRKGEDAASSSASQLHKKLSTYYLEYLSSSDKKKFFQQFKSNCDTAIIEARKVLAKHRGWKNILANLMLHIALLLTTAGIGNIAAAGYAYYSSTPGQKSLFFALTNTDSAKHINNIDLYVNKLSN